MIWVAPSEPSALKTIGRSSAQPEKFGVDILFTARAALCGVQRKEFSDFLASVHDGRLTREFAQMTRLAHSMLLIEGQPRWSLDGNLLNGNGHGWAWTRTQHRNYLTSVQARGVAVCESDDLADTITAVHGFVAWCRKGVHQSLERRPKPKGRWGKAGHRDFQLHLLQSFDGIGPKQAAAIVDRFGGVPMAWTVGEKELREVEGIGVKKARRLMEALEAMGVREMEAG